MGLRARKLITQQLRQLRQHCCSIKLEMWCTYPVNRAQFIFNFVSNFCIRVVGQGESDVCDAPFMEANSCVTCSVEDGGLDTSCEAETQGWCRMARLHAFSQ